MNKRHYEHTLPNIRGSLSNTYIVSFIRFLSGLKYRVVILGVKASYGILALVEMLGQHMVDVGGQGEPVMPDYADDAHDAVVVLRAHIRHLSRSRLHFGFTDEQTLIVFLTAFADFRGKRYDFHARLHLGNHALAVLLRHSSFFVLFLFHVRLNLPVVFYTVR